MRRAGKKVAGASSSGESTPPSAPSDPQMLFKMAEDAQDMQARPELEAPGSCADRIETAAGTPQIIFARSDQTPLNILGAGMYGYMLG